MVDSLLSPSIDLNSYSTATAVLKCDWSARRAQYIAHGLDTAVVEVHMIRLALSLVQGNALSIH